MGDFVKLKTNPFPAKYPVAPLVGPDGQRIDPRTVARAQDLERLKEAAIDLRNHTDGWVNVKTYGAKGDGTTDDTAAIQAAIDSITVTAWPGAAAGMYARGGGTVILPQGVYRITAPLKLGQHVRLVGSGSVGYNHPGYLQSKTDPAKQKGTVLFADFAAPNAWAIDSATYTTADGLPVPYRDVKNGADFDSGAINATHGISIENLMLVSGATPVYGAIRLIGSPGATIQNVGAIGFNIGGQINASWDGAVRDFWAMSYWYGLIATTDVNTFTFDNVRADRLTAPAPTAPTLSTVPLGVPTDYSWFGLSYDYRLKPTAFVFHYAHSITLNATSEHFDASVQAINSSGSIGRLYAEGNALVDVVTAGSALHVGSIYSYSSPAVPRFDVGTVSKITLGRATGPAGYTPPYEWLISVPLDATISISSPTFTTREQWKVIGATDQPAFLSDWVNDDAAGPFGVAAFYKDASGETHVKGLLKSGTTGIIFWLPAGYRPANRLATFTVDGAGGVARIDVRDDGAVEVISLTDNSFLPMNLAFRADQ